jgi:CheY-like chemotaxis protein
MPSTTPLPLSTTATISPLDQITHDLRNPLNVILGMSEALLDGYCGSLNDRQLKALQAIDCAGNTLLERINDLQTLPPDALGRTLISAYPATEPQHLQSMTAPSANPPTILIADDNTINTEMLSDFLSDIGYTILTAHDGAIALELIFQHNPDIVLMDIQMPTIDGITAIERVRSSHCPQPPIIAVTALAMTNDRDRCLQAGATAYLSKPIKLQPLLALIQSLLAPPALKPPA